MIYLICTYLLLIGLVGLAAQLFLGFSHAGHAGGHGHVAHHAQGQNAAHGHAHHDGKTDAAGGNRAAGINLLFALLSPLMLFTVCLGAGAAGLLLKHHHLPVYEVAEAAALSGIALYAAVVRPIWRMLFRFASAPSAGLEGAVGTEARAVSRFDTTGRGLVALTIDGQLANNVLAFLDDSDKNNAEEIQPGDLLTITSVDSQKNSCRVTRL